MVYLDMDIRKLIKNYQTPPNGQEIIKCGNILLIAGVSGAGKDSIKHKLVSGKKYGDIISHTTRPPRVNNKITEKNGKIFDVYTNSADESLRVKVEQPISDGITN